MTALAWEQNQQNLITFVMIDGSGGEVSGLGAGLTMKISKAGGAFVAVAGVQAEMSDGWYRYLGTAGEADTPGPVSILASGVGTVQQNLEYVVKARTIYAVEFTYTVTNSITALPVQGATVSVSTDVAGANVVFSGVTDAFGVLRHVSTGQKPWLDPGPYYFWTFADGFASSNPDLETVS
jgi:hypothetical protein